ncbi:MAG: methylenetetrahydrofolate reductase [NAD(P)H] [Phycisphaerales bacterium]|jgi:methylenetetrahydrofolate reductase (NADPH)|nr:methylenetetrahydrofolate reductase [NAD(P)H] [Phycisphaerales bacterium]
MHVKGILERDTTIFSFEFFPPKSETGWEGLVDRLHSFESLEPSFVSVTYGADGSTRDKTHELVTHLAEKTPLDPVPHLTCVGHTTSEITSLLHQYSLAGVDNILALRGDPVQGAQVKSAFDHAADLVSHIKNYPNKQFGICVAGFPEGHPETPNRLVQLDHLKQKVDTGADWICSQLFFDNRAFLDWCQRCELRGITIPIVAGIMPITSIASMKRMAELAGGTNFPAALLKRLYRFQDDQAAVKQIGTQWAAEQCADLLDHSVRGIHFYTMNQSLATEEIFRSLGTITGSRLRNPS